jgi:hypothetical protein
MSLDADIFFVFFSCMRILAALVNQGGAVFY